MNALLQHDEIIYSNDRAQMPLAVDHSSREHGWQG